MLSCEFFRFQPEVAFHCMSNGQPYPVPTAAHSNRWLTEAASLAVGAAFFALWFWLLPRWLGFSVEMSGAARWR